MRIIFSENAWEDYLSWHQGDKKNLKKINELIKSIARTPFERIGKPEPLKFDLAGSLIMNTGLFIKLLEKISSSLDVGTIMTGKNKGTNDPWSSDRMRYI